MHTELQNFSFSPILLRELSFFLRMFYPFSSSTFLSGSRSSAYYGQGLDFAELLQYQEGDDADSIDWAASLRSGRLYRRTYQEEKAVPTYVVCDFSASLLSQENLAQNLRKTAGLLCRCAEINQDPLGIIFFTDEIELFLKAEPGARQLKKILSNLQNFTPKNRGTNIKRLLTETANVLKQKSQIFLLSDLLTEDFKKELQFFCSRHELFVCHFTADYFADFKHNLWLKINNPEDISRSSLHNLCKSSELQQRQKEHFSKLQEDLQSCKTAYVQLAANQDSCSILLNYFRSRIGK